MVKIPVEDCAAGPALDAAVAKQLGWNDPAFKAYGKDGFYDNGRRITPRWSADISRAWELVEEAHLCEIAPLAITRAFLKASGVEFVEANEVINA